MTYSSALTNLNSCNLLMTPVSKAGLHQSANNELSKISDWLVSNETSLNIAKFNF